ncbi:hypothetical protein N9140_00420, partial [bacterium]|nr:hypothetical protein [bacterium]
MQLQTHNKCMNIATDNNHHSSILLSNNKRATNINNCNSILMKSWHQYLSLLYPHHVSTQSVNFMLEDGRR